MSGSRSFLKLVFLFALVVGIAPLSACGGPKVVHSAVKAGDMPSGADWTGVYYSQIYGYLHLIKEGDTINGRWRNTAGDTWGELSGKVTGNLLRYEWTNHKIGLVGPSATSHGKGYFLYTRPHEGEADELHGEWGLEESDAGNAWSAVKQKDMKPDFKSVVPDEYEGRGEGGGWDQSNSTAKPPTGDGDNGDSSGSDDSGGDNSPPPSDDPLNGGGGL